MRPARASLRTLGMNGNRMTHPRFKWRPPPPSSPATQTVTNHSSWLVLGSDPAGVVGVRDGEGGGWIDDQDHDRPPYLIAIPVRAPLQAAPPNEQYTVVFIRVTLCLLSKSKLLLRRSGPKRELSKPYT